MKLAFRQRVAGLRRRLRRLGNGPTWKRILSHPSPQIAAIGRALRETGSGRLDAEERPRVQAIEDRRQSLLRSSAAVTFLDYGAGNPGSGRTEAQMLGGVATTLPVSTICGSSKSPFWALLLFKMIRALEPRSCLELGTCLGISAAYQATALALNGRGRLITIEGARDVAAIAGETMQGLGLSGFAQVRIGPFHESLAPALEAARPVDFLFNDGHHDGKALLRYFQLAFPYMAEESIVVFDDIAWSRDMRAAWREIGRDKRVAVTIDLGVIGVALLSKGLSRQAFSLVWP